MINWYFLFDFCLISEMQPITSSSKGNPVIPQLVPILPRQQNLNFGYGTSSHGMPMFPPYGVFPVYPNFAQFPFRPQIPQV